RNDWCISRQRVWGVPIPVFYCDGCGEAIVTPETISHVAGLFREHGSNVWFEQTADELIPSGFVCPKCGGAHFSKENDIMDVWFDSGSTWAAVADQRDNLQYPADVYLEGGDQYRGWFQSSMLTSIACNGVAPYKQIITHGWTVDGEGKAMHKSLGNAMPPEEIIKDYGADMLRLWVSSADYTQDMRISKEIMKQLSQAYLKIRNTARYMLGNLDGFDPSQAVAPADMLDLDKWAVSAFNDLVKAVRAGYDSYEFHAVYRAIYSFCVVEMSNFYLDIIKDRLYCGGDAERASAQSALYLIVDGMTRMLAPILAFTSQELWTSMPHRAGDDVECVLFNDIPDYDPALALDQKEAERWAELLHVRDVVLKALEEAKEQVKKNQDAEITLHLPEKAFAAWEAGTVLPGFDEAALATLFIVSKVTVVKRDGEPAGADVDATVSVRLSQAPKCPRCWNHDEGIGTPGHHAELCARCAAVLGE
ncbi:MAG: class I tRNA ligase family protein, partial [Oscillospiraceae bacterium]|nr:class I tRNA ligase family protein [Oscillospiraceae bacterium]